MNKKQFRRYKQQQTKQQKKKQQHSPSDQIVGTIYWKNARNSE